MRRFWIYIILLALAGVLGFQVYKLDANKDALTDQFNKIKAQADSLAAENSRLEQSIDYFSDPHNLEKELRARFNYRLPWENLIIVVPKQ
jgi:cell division protein FtsB